MSFGGIDVGTSGCKCTLFDDRANQLAVAYRAYEPVRSTGRHEIDILMIWGAVKEVITEAAVKTGDPPEAISVSSFGESCALLDKDDKPVIPAIIYTDPRGSDEVVQLAGNPGEYPIFKISGHRPNASYTLPKLMWCQTHLPDEMARVTNILPIASAIMYFLTGERVCDTSLAARTMMLDMHKLTWSDELVRLAGISTDVLPDVVRIGTPAGVIRRTIAEELGVPSTVKIVAGGHDQVVAAIGAGILEAGSAVNSSGTVECLTPVFGSIEKPEKLFAGQYPAVPMLEGVFATYSVVFSGSVLLHWFCENFTGASTGDTVVYDRLDSMGQDGPTGIMVQPHFAGSGSPHYDPYSTGAITGLTLEHSAGDVYQALQEGICYESALNLELFQDAGITIDGLRIVGGGEKSRRWNQMKADIYGIPCTTLKAGEAGATGSAMLAGVALGRYAGLEQAVVELVHERETFLPRPEYTERYRPYFERYRNMYDAVKSIWNNKEEPIC